MAAPAPAGVMNRAFTQPCPTPPGLVVARIMSYEYLWHNIREVGGAYGTGMLTRAQTEGLYTYRDPHLTESYETFAKAPEVLAGREYT